MYSSINSSLNHVLSQTEHEPKRLKRFPVLLPLSLLTKHSCVASLDSDAVVPNFVWPTFWDDIKGTGVCLSQKMTLLWCHPLLYTALHTALQHLLYWVLNRSISTPEIGCKKILVKWDVGRVNGTRVILYIDTDQVLPNPLKESWIFRVKSRKYALLSSQAWFSCIVVLLDRLWHSRAF